MINKEKFRNKLGTWFEDIEPLFDNGVMETIFKELKDQSNKGLTIAPDNKRTFRCFLETPKENLRVVMMGYCPYHTVVHNKLVADGLLMGCSNHKNYLAPSLQQYYGAVEEEFKEGLCLPCIQDGDVTFLARQGVLMFNSSLTTLVGEPGAHTEIWRPFTEYMMGVFNRLTVPIIFLGNDAWQYSDCNNLHHKLSHPASASHNGQKWHSQGVFKQVNQKLEDWYQAPISWVLETPPF